MYVLKLTEPRWGRVADVVKLLDDPHTHMSSRVEIVWQIGTCSYIIDGSCTVVHKTVQINHISRIFMNIILNCDGKIAYK